MSRIPTRSRSKAFARQQGRCFYCQFPMWLAQPDEFASSLGITKADASRFQCTAEHLVARQDGGGNSSKNIVAACRFCNNTRHKIPSAPNPTAYRARVSERLTKGKWHPKHLQKLKDVLLRATT